MRSATAVGGRIVSYRPGSTSMLRAIHPRRRTTSAYSASTSTSAKSGVVRPTYVERVRACDLPVISTWPAGCACRRRTPVDVATYGRGERVLGEPEQLPVLRARLLEDTAERRGERAQHAARRHRRLVAPPAVAAGHGLVGPDERCRVVGRRRLARGALGRPDEVLDLVEVDVAARHRAGRRPLGAVDDGDDGERAPPASRRSWSGCCPPSAG
jgi:hypothetical protein